MIEFQNKKKKIRDQVKQQLDSARFGFASVKRVEACLVESDVAA